MANDACHIYIICNRRNGTLYVGVTSGIKRRIWEHKNKTIPGFSAKYGLGRLVYLEAYKNIADAISREKQIKAGSRAKKIVLIETENPNWDDLAVNWFG